MFETRTDLALEAHELYRKKKLDNSGIESREYQKDGIKVTEIRITDEKGEKALGKPVGSYVTLEVPDLLYSSEVYEKACYVLAEELRKMYPVNDDTKILTVCLGNEEITADAVGVKVFKQLMVTRHMKKYIPEHIDESIRSVAALAPGVIGTTGIETADIIKGVAEKVKPDVIFAVDALKARNVDRISTTIQLSDTGIAPGSGVGNFTNSVSEETVGAKVIAIGVPTVVDAVTIVNDSIEMMADFAGEAQALEKLGDRKRIELIEKSISSDIGGLVVTPKEIDRICEKVSMTIANGINLAVHRDLSLNDIDGYM